MSKYPAGYVDAIYHLVKYSRARLEPVQVKTFLWLHSGNTKGGLLFDWFGLAC